ncbi:hypothetical protein CBL_20823 [Carabus blaptoides fortunei]
MSLGYSSIPLHPPCASNESGSVEWYSLALDESTDQVDTAQLLIFIRACNENFEIVEELLSMQSMKHQTTGDDIFEEIKNCLLSYNLPWNKLISVTTDGAPSLTGAKIGKQQRESDDMWKADALPLIRAGMSRDRFKMMLQFIRFDNVNTRAESAQTNKAAPILDIWTMQNRNLERAYRSHESITNNELFFLFKGHTEFLHTEFWTWSICAKALEEMSLPITFSHLWH